MNPSQTNNQQKNNLPSKLAKPAQRALANAGITRLDQLNKLSEAEVKQLHGIGPNALNLLQQALHDIGLSFAEKKTG